VNKLHEEQQAIASLNEKLGHVCIFILYVASNINDSCMKVSNELDSHKHREIDLQNENIQKESELVELKDAVENLKKDNADLKVELEETETKLNNKPVI
jgi:predicted nuclease with TOPRIM domain